MDRIRTLLFSYFYLVPFPLTTFCGLRVQSHCAEGTLSDMSVRVLDSAGVTAEVGRDEKMSSETVADVIQ